MKTALLAAAFVAAAITAASADQQHQCYQMPDRSWRCQQPQHAAQFVMGVRSTAGRHVALRSGLSLIHHL
jgi:hypothetical protein